MDYELTVTDTHAVPVPLSKYGKEFFSKDRIRSTMYVAVTLAPRKSRVDTWAINDLFEFARDGRYLVTVKRQFRAGKINQSVSSNVLEIVLD